MKALMFAALLAASAGAQATGLYAYAGAWSEHFSSDQFEETHNLAALEYRSYMAGYFRNSYGEDSVFAAKRWSWDYGNWQVGVAVGAVYGYRSCIKGWDDQSRRVCPMVAPSLVYTEYAVQPSLLVMGKALVFTVRTDLDAVIGALQ